MLLIRTGAPATQGDLNILKAPGQPKHLSWPTQRAQGHTLTSMPSDRCVEKQGEKEHGKSQTQYIHGKERGLKAGMKTYIIMLSQLILCVSVHFETVPEEMLFKTPVYTWKRPYRSSTRPARFYM